MRKKCVEQLCYDHTNVEALGIGDSEFVSCNNEVYKAMMDDWMINLEVKLPTLIKDGTNLLVYAREYDFLCNWIGKV